MRKLIKSFEGWLKQLNLFYFIVIILLLTYLAATIAALISVTLGIEDIVWKTKSYDALEDQIFAFFSAITIAPLLETLIFQKVPTDLLCERPLFRKKPYLLVLISSVSFGLLHIRFAPSCAILAFLVGLILIWGYLIRYNAKKQPFTAIWLVHLIRNTIAVGVSIYKAYLA